MARVSVSRELPASRDHVWALIADPGRLPDWWPGIVAVTPDRLGLAPGGRWQVRGVERPTLRRHATSSGTLLVREIVTGERVAWTLTGDRIDAELRLAERAADLTVAVLAIDAPWFSGVSRALPRRALARLYAACLNASGT